MFDELLPFYERELSAIRALAAEFAERYPKVARRLQLAPDHCDDPDVERLLESFAWMAARIGRRLDDEVPELAEPLIQMLCPAFTRPIPSATIIQLALDPRETALAGKYTVPRHTLALSPPVQGIRCAFRTTHAVDLWPVDVAGAELRLTRDAPGAAVLVLDLAARNGLPFSRLKVDRLRFFLDGEPPVASLLYELLAFRVLQVRAAGAALPPGALRPAGFGPEEALYDDDPRSFQGFRLLFEYFAFPEKFLFFDLAGLDRAGLEGAGDRLRVECLLSGYGTSGRHRRLLETLSPAHFRLGCVPALNLHPQDAVPIAVDCLRAGHPVLPAGRAASACEVHSIDSVLLGREGSGIPGMEVPALYSLRPGPGAAEPGLAWCAVRERSAAKDDPGTDVTLALVDLEGRAAHPAGTTLELRLTCSDLNLPEAIPFGSGAPEREGFLLARHALVASTRALRKPTPSLGPPCGAGLHWRIIAHLFMNDLTLAGLTREGLQGLLELYNFSGSVAAARQIQGIDRVETRPVTTLLGGPGPPRFARGTEVAITLDERLFEGAHPLLFASVLERFLAQSCPQGSFVQVRVSGRLQEGELARWPPRRGGTALI